MSSSWLYISCLEEQHHQQGDTDHGEKGGDEGHLGHHRDIFLVLQTEDGAIGGYRHSDDQCINVDYQRRESQCTHQEMDTDGQEYQSEEGSGIDGRVA